MKDNIEFRGLNERLYGVPLVGGLLGGLLSFVAGYLSFLGIAAGTGEGIDFDARSLREIGQFFYNSFLVPTHQRTTQVIENEAEGETVLQETVMEVWYNPFYQSDSVDVEQRTYLDGTLFQEDSRTIAVESTGGWALPDLTFPDVVYLAVPVVVLFAVGFLLAYRFISLDGIRGWGDVLARGLVGGGMITLGFALFALLGSYLFTIDGVAVLTAETGEGLFTRPDRLDTLLFGLAYPAVCSTAGVLVGQLLRRQTFEGVERPEPTPEDVGPDPEDGEAVADTDPDATADQ